MFKHSTPIKKFNCLLLAAVLLAASCKKQQDDPQQEQIDPNQQKEIHAYQNGNEVKTISLTEFKKKVDLKTLGTLQQAFEKPEFTKDGTMLLNNEQTYEGFAIQTDSIKMLTANGHTSYIFPVKLASPRAISFQNLTIDQSAEGTKIFVNTYTPTKKWITDWKAGKAGKFDGDIEVVYLNSPTPTATQDKKVMTNSNGCSTTTYYYELPYNCASGQHGPNDAGCYLTGSDRAGVAFVYITVTNCDGAGGGGNTTPTPPGPYNPCDGVPTMPSPDSRTNMSAGAKVMNVPPTGCDPVPPVLPDCAGVPGGTAYVDPNCNTCIGGTTGLTACLSKRTVTDSTTTPCIKSAVSLGKQANTTIGKMLNKTFGPSNEYGGLDIEFRQGNTGTADGTCRKNGNISWLITINENLPNAASKEYILATVYHEILHAYLESIYPKDALGKFLIPHDEHQDMAEKYLILMIGALKINYPGLSDNEAWGLAWGGLEKTPFYNDNTKLTANQRLEIGEINRKHKNKSNPVDRSGTYCP